MQMKFSITITSIYTGIHLSKSDGRWFQIYVINDVIMTSQLVLKIINDLANFLILSDTSIFLVSPYNHVERNLDFANKFNNITF